MWGNDFGRAIGTLREAAMEIGNDGEDNKYYWGANKKTTTTEVLPVGPGYQWQKHPAACLSRKPLIAADVRVEDDGVLAGPRSVYKLIESDEAIVSLRCQCSDKPGEGPEEKRATSNIQCSDLHFVLLHVGFSI